MAGLESFNMAYQRHQPSRSISVNPSQLQLDLLDNDTVRQQQRDTLIEMSRNKGNFIFL